MGFWSDAVNSGWLGSDVKQYAADDAKKAAQASGNLGNEKSSSMAQDNYKDKTTPSDQSDAMKRRMQQAGGN